MYEPTLITWIIIAYGLITCSPLLYAQLVMLIKPHSAKAKSLMIGEGEEWRDNSHFKIQCSFAKTDWYIFTPFFLIGILGIILGQNWGYFFIGCSGAIQLYINIILFFFEKDYVYKAQGPLAYYTYYWGNFIYWSIAVIVYSILRLNDIVL